MEKHEIARLCEQAEMTAWTDMFDGAPPDFSRAFGLGVEHFGGIVALRCVGVGITVFNRVMGVGVHEPATEKRIDEIIAHYVSMGVGRFIFQICPTAQPRQIVQWLTARGFTYSGDWAKVSRFATHPDPIPTDLRVEKLNPDQGEIFAQTLSVGYGLPDQLRPLMSGMVGRPGWHTYIAYDGDQPVSTGALYVKDGIGWLGAGATLPSHRRRGGQSAIMTRRVADGIALGCQWLVTETGAERPDQPNPSLHNMLRTGFNVGYLRADYLSPKLI